MPNFQASVRHNLSEQEALARMKKLFEKIRRDLPDVIHNAKEEWKGNVCCLGFSMFGFRISGKLIVKSPYIEFAGELPFLALFFEDKIKAVISFQAGLVLGKEL